jgi:nucleoside-diphosphate-sugar epimerase
LIQPVWNREVACCISHIARNDRTFGQAFNCPGSECVTTRRYYQLVADRLGVPLQADSISLCEFRARHPDRAPFARHRLYDTRLLERVGAYRPQLSLDDALGETIAWMESATA